MEKILDSLQFSAAAGLATVPSAIFLLLAIAWITNTLRNMVEEDWWWLPLRLVFMGCAAGSAVFIFVFVLRMVLA